MRVLIAHNRYRFPGGEERHVDLLEAGLQAAGVETRRFERDSREMAGSLVGRVVAGVTMTYRPSSARSIARVLEEWKPNVVHAHNLFPLLTPAVLRAAKRAGAAVVITLHNYRFACPAGTLWRDGKQHDDCLAGSSIVCGLRNARGSRAESVAYGFAVEMQRRLRLLERWVDVYVAPSNFMHRALVRAGLPERRIHTIYHGIPIPDEPPREARFALYAGRLSPEKGVRTLLCATALAPEVPVVVAGDGPLAHEVRARRESVRYVGQLSPTRLAELRREAAFTILPSESPEVLPLAAIESIAAAKPAIATRMGGLPEIVEEGVSGVLADAGSPDGLVAAMRGLWEAPTATAALGRSARERAAERFSLEGQTARLLELYRGVAGRSERPSCAGGADE